jgi:hypothetical protein
VTIKSGEFADLTVEVSQTAATATLGASKVSIAAIGATKTVSVTTSVSAGCQASPSEDAAQWLTVTPAVLSGQTIVITAEPNPTLNSRSATVYVSCGDLAVKEIAVTQTGEAWVLIDPPGPFTAAAAGDQLVVNVRSNKLGDAYATISAAATAWLSADVIISQDDDGVPLASITITATANDSDQSRTGSVTVRSGAGNYSLTVTQLAG